MIKCVYKTVIPSFMFRKKKDPIKYLLPRFEGLVGIGIYFNEIKIGRIDCIHLVFNENKKLYMEIRYVVTSTPAIEKMIKDHKIGLSMLDWNSDIRAFHLGKICEKDVGKERVTHEIFISGE